MITLLLIWCLVWSAATRVDRFFFPDSKPNTISLFRGLSIILLASQAWCLVLPGHYFAFPLIILALMGYKSWISGLSEYRSISTWLVLIACLIPGTLESWINDDISYYLQSIKWYAARGFPEGLANLNFRYGFGSSWHTLSAAFYWEGLSPDRIWNLNGLILFVFLSEQIRKGKIVMALATTALCILFTNAPSPDLPLILFGSLMISEFKTLKVNDWLVLIAGVISIKATSLGLGLLILYPLFNSSLVTIKRSWIVLLAMALVVSRNLILSGLPLFPLEGLHVFKSESAIDLKALYDLVTQIKAETYDLGHHSSDWNMLQDEHGLAAIFIGFTYMRTYKLVLVSLIVISGFYLLIEQYKKKNRILPVWVILFLAIWIFTAPNYRFALFLPLGVLGMITTNFQLSGKLKILTSGLMILIAIALNTRGTEALTRWQCGDSRSLEVSQVIIPLPYPDILVKHEDEPFQHYVPEHCAVCGDAPLPCVTDSVKKVHRIDAFKAK